MESDLPDDIRDDALRVFRAAVDSKCTIKVTTSSNVVFDEMIFLSHPRTLLAFIHYSGVSFIFQTVHKSFTFTQMLSGTVVFLLFTFRSCLIFNVWDVRKLLYVCYLARIFLSTLLICFLMQCAMPNASLQQKTPSPLPPPTHSSPDTK